ncbi:hypothetical protein TorRG33x02_341890 [Trema orientale]|uniref:Uncharacterized protein n=1 Tax=Trema orientale TaxID=63057 RepID=A0A2P5AT68_TREOI|nr:hypothetical protein TorRG33x02_341890 [Trema orientale]
MVWRSAVMIDADLVVHFVIRHVFIWGWSSLMRLGMIIRSKSLTCSFSTRDRNGSSIGKTSPDRLNPQLIFGSTTLQLPVAMKDPSFSAEEFWKRLGTGRLSST